LQLTAEQKRKLIEDGYIVIPGAVPKRMIDDAMKAINHSIGRGIPEQHGGANYCAELEREPVIMDLYKQTDAAVLLGSLVGSQCDPVHNAQIALRFPEYRDSPDPSAGAHLDGLLKLKEGVVQNFTALVGIMLSDQLEPGMGNFTVYPGSHRLYEQYFRERGPDVLLHEQAIQTKFRSPNIALPQPVQLTGQAGDMVISHYQLVHAGGPNTSPRIRYSCYYRIFHSDIQSDWRAPLTSMWKHWPGLQDVLEG
jgi:hypothetical protein